MNIYPDATPTVYHLQVTAYVNDGFTSYRVVDSPVLDIEVLEVPPVAFGPKTTPITMWFPKGQLTEVSL